MRTSSHHGQRCRLTITSSGWRAFSARASSSASEADSGSVLPAAWEKGFVRQLSEAEITALAERTRIIHCGSCGAPVDLRQHGACPYCRAALSLLDPQAVERALDGYHTKAQRQAEGPRAPDLADALITLERDRERARREAQQQRWQGRSPSSVDELWLAGINLVWQWLSRRG